jgi:outer membrane protein assembly factor BamB
MARSWIAVALGGCAAARAPAPLAATPSSGAAIVWRIRDATSVVTSRTRTTGMIAIAEPRAVRIVDPRDGHRDPVRWVLDPNYMAVDGERTWVGGGMVGGVVELGPRGAERWRFATDAESSAGPIAMRGGRAVVAWFRSGDDDVPRDELIRLGENGQLLWRQPLPDGYRAFALDPIGIAICRLGDVTSERETTPMLALGFEPETGRLRWQHRFVAGRDVAIDGVRVAIVSEQKLAIIDVASGAMREVALSGHTASVVAVGGDIAYVASAAGEGGVVAAIGLVDGLVRWTQPVARAAARIAVTDHAVYTLSTGAILYELDRATGRLRSTWSLGDADTDLVAGPGDRLYAHVPELGLIAFSPGMPPPLETATVRGRVDTCGTAERAVVHVGDAEVIADSTGRFEVTVAARGWLQVTLPTDANSSRVVTQVRLVGHGRYNAGLLRPRTCRDR